ncbi:hypothetical protein [Erythrobacter sp. F6033]|uniref:hypothetical protein n=1 Tax=Erythrobacter sp. F6033 TaxID=2926401 RepID=UPI001FF5A18B|nr:hypothetical protein [Erythrobacter sp. F6033]MCK0129782.1 hypothetical protein [Erythrobacter sp. F6033]
MFRKVLPILAIPLLTACGGKDFVVKVDASSERVAKAFTQLNPNSLTSAAGVRPVKITRETGEDFRAVRYTLPNPGGDSGEFLFHMTEESAGRTTIDVTVDLPMVTRETAAGTEYLSEPEIEKALRFAMRSWDRDIEKGRSTAGSAEEVAEVISLAAIGMQDLEQFEELATTALYQRHLSEAAQASWSSTTDDWGGDSGETSWAYDDAAQDSYSYEEDMSEGGGWGDGS